MDDLISLHWNSNGAIFQAASQFNCLEFPSSSVTPEEGISGYITDRTQGPACAIACAAGTVYRNYLVPINDGSIGQSHDNQLNNLDEVEKFLSPDEYWKVRNGYTFSNVGTLSQLNNRLKSNTIDIDEIRKRIKVGIQESVGVTFKSMKEVTKFDNSEPDKEILNKDHEDTPIVTQVYCSALSCAYSGVGVSHWEPFARIVLDAMYEATLLSALTHKPTTSEELNRRVFLTFIGGGVFGNDMKWIVDSIVRAVNILRGICSTDNGSATISTDESTCTNAINIEIFICHYRRIDPAVKKAIDDQLAVV